MFSSSVRLHSTILGIAALALSACADGGGPATAASDASQPDPGKSVEGGKLQTAIFAGGCFWCVEEAFDKLPGVVETTSGYTGGDVENPTYKQVTGGGTGHYEALRVRYNPAEVSYSRLLDQFWHNVDPFDARGQFCDKGESYRSAIFSLNDEQRQQAETSRQQVRKQLNASQPIATKIIDAGTFYRAEDYHQDYHQRNSLRYTFYKTACGRADRLEEVWGEEVVEGPVR